MTSYPSASGSATTEQRDWSKGTNETTFVKIPDWLLQFGPDLTLGAKIVYGVIADECRRNQEKGGSGSASLAASFIAERAGMTRQTVQAAVKALLAARLIEYDRGGYPQRPNHYWLSGVRCQETLHLAPVEVSDNATGRGKESRHVGVKEGDTSQRNPELQRVNTQRASGDVKPSPQGTARTTRPVPPAKKEVDSYIWATLACLEKVWTDLLLPRNKTANRLRKTVRGMLADIHQRDGLDKMQQAAKHLIDIAEEKKKAKGNGPGQVADPIGATIAQFRKTWNLRRLLYPSESMG